MKIEEAKSDLEKEIIFWDGVIGIGVVQESTTPLIEIAIDKEDKGVSQKINNLINNNKWMGFDVIITPTEKFKKQ